MEEYKKGNPSAFSPTHVFGNSNFRIINGSRISCWTSHANGRHSNQTLAAALNNSCNPIFTDIALSLGVETFYDYLDLFGIGENTGIDFAGEQAGMLVPEASVTAGDLARIGFGQTIAVTPLQLIAAVSCAVNGGLLMKPYLVREIRSGDMTAARFTPSVRNRAVSEETSRNLALMLEDEQNGWYQVRYQGKTGYVSADYVEVIEVTLEEYNQLSGNSESSESSGSSTSSEDSSSSSGSSSGGESSGETSSSTSSADEEDGE